MNIIKIKGGSLSSTELHRGERGSFIRKSVRLDENREYGFMRWYSQLKKIQRFGVKHPNLFPKILAVNHDGTSAYMDLEYLHSFKDIKTILSNENLTEDEIYDIVDSVVASLNSLHKNTYTSNPSSGALYFREEIYQKYVDALKYPVFREFVDLGHYDFNGQRVNGIEHYLSALEEYFNGVSVGECDIHGNPTLENILYSKDEKRSVFIDLYEESMIDCAELDFAQVLQCSNSYYGYINDRDVRVDGRTISDDHVIPMNFKIFNQRFKSSISADHHLIDVLEATQFIRMLPFKLASNNIDHAKYFYVYACKRFNEVL